MFEQVNDSQFITGEHDMLAFWRDRCIFDKLREKNADKPQWSFLDGPITANNPMGVHHAWGRTYKDAFQRFHASDRRATRAGHLILQLAWSQWPQGIPGDTGGYAHGNM